MRGLSLAATELPEACMALAQSLQQHPQVQPDATLRSSGRRAPPLSMHDSRVLPTSSASREVPLCYIVAPTQFWRARAASECPEPRYLWRCAGVSARLLASRKRDRRFLQD